MTMSFKLCAEPITKNYSNCDLRSEDDYLRFRQQGHQDAYQIGKCRVDNRLPLSSPEFQDALKQLKSKSDQCFQTSPFIKSYRAVFPSRPLDVSSYLTSLEDTAKHNSSGTMLACQGGSFALTVGAVFAITKYLPPATAVALGVSGLLVAGIGLGLFTLATHVGENLSTD